MSNDKSGSAKRGSGSKTLPDKLTRWKMILSLISHGESSVRIQQAINKQWAVSKVTYSNDIHEMIYEGWIVDLKPMINKYKYYAITESGSTVLAGWDKDEKKTLTKIENARHVVKIRNEKWLNQFLSKESYMFERHDLGPNQKTYYGKVIEKYYAMNVAVHIGKEVSMVLTPAPMYAEDLITGHHKIHQTMLDFCNMLNEKWNFDLTIPKPTSHRQYTISDDFAKTMLKASGGSQLKLDTEDGMVSIDQSHQQEKRIEFPTLKKAVDYLEVPRQIEILTRKMEEMNLREQQRDDALLKLVAAIENNSQRFDKLVDLISGQKQVQSDKEQVKVPDMTDLAKNMFR